VTTEELKARTKAFALRVIKLVDAMPRSLAAQVIGKQLLHLPSLSIVNRRSSIPPIQGRTHERYDAGPKVRASNANQESGRAAVALRCE
jgi:hypothetical protein